MAEDQTSADTFVIWRDIDAPRDLVWKAYSEVDRLAQWWGPKGFDVPNGTLDFRPGGVYQYGLQSPAGQQMWGKFNYQEIAAPERIVFVSTFSDPSGGTTRAPFSDSWPLETLNTVTFTERDGKTTLALSAVPVNATEPERETFRNAFDSLRTGFTGTLDRLAEYLAKEQARTG